MKGKFIFGILLITMCIFIAGCNKKENAKENEKGNEEKTVLGGWTIDDVKEQSNINADALNTFKNVNDKNYKLVALLGEQVVAGTNYMFLVKDGSSYKVIVVYNDLDNNSKITSTEAFDITKYVNKDISYKGEKVSGGWNVTIPTDEVKLDSEVQSIFEQATNEMTGISYSPINVLAHQLVSGTNYAVLAYGSLTTAEENNGVYLITLYKDLKGASKIASSAYIDLAEFNK